MLAKSVMLAMFGVNSVLSHGYLMSPPNRKGGLAYANICGAAIAAKDKSDYTQEVQTLGRPPSAGCDLFLCKGYQFGDVAASDVQNYTLGQNVTFHYDMTIPHPSNDPTNVTIIDTKTRQIISSNLFMVASLGMMASKLDIMFNMPTHMATGSCKVAGDCVLALNWDAVSIGQTLQSCVDFVIS